MARSFKFDQKTLSADDRRAIAAAALAYWRHFDQRIPRNSPDKAAWLSGEMNTTDLARIQRITVTPEFALLQLSDLSSVCVDLFREAENSVGTEKLFELYSWTRSLYCYASPVEIERYLRQSGLASSGEFKLDHYGLMHSVITGKLASSVVAGQD
ncbi:hypothetical protein GOB36_02275 [Sinorhizobium meliloti]|uniref:hypothetical protein n=1 Tax=Rhizobium meliloti TaxID=382 RepID=UPI00299E4009|nr:hypothetical protein [Sinorhizobium meliloti]MDW9919379.1 hypothetical protein [Sinorhizobium meliloti]MDX0035721.1 hypothetical protein [Sinorhizobium meliloti]MDX0363523.1 hypothetical protein [Sinorhizobium meliloti]